MIVRDGGGCRELPILPRTALYDAECFFPAKMRSPARSAVPPPSEEKRTPRFCGCGGHTRRAAARGGGARQRSLASRPKVPRGRCEQHFVPARNPRAVVLRQKSICDNQSHHARENQQCRDGFSDHWHRRMACSRSTGLRFRPSREPPDFAFCRWCASLWFRRRAHASHLAVISAVDLANSRSRGLGLAHRLESGSIVSQKALCV
jgi:hypothetical protein